MAHPFAQLIPEARFFLAERASNNSRDWFNANQAGTRDHLKTPSLLLQEHRRADLTKTYQISATAKLFRPQRDSRVSKDKSPYHPHLRMLWVIKGKLDFGLFLGISPSYCKIGGDIMGFDKAQRLQWRTTLDSTQGREIAALLDALAHQMFTAKPPCQTIGPGAAFKRDDSPKFRQLHLAINILGGGRRPGGKAPKNPPRRPHPSCASRATAAMPAWMSEARLR